VLGPEAQPAGNACRERGGCDECDLVAHTKLRQKFRNLATEPRIAVSMHDPDDPYRSLEVRGAVETVVDDAGADYYRQRSQRYGIGTVLDDAAVRVIISVRPTAFITYGPARKPTPTV
jgi:hypothetical protein